MKLAEVPRKAFAMPLNDPAYPPGPYKFYNREFVVITYRTDPDRLREVVPEPLEVAGDTVAYEFIRMPDSTGFGDYTETGQVIPVRFKTKDGTVQEGGYVHAMYLDDNAPIAGGREIWGFPKKLASPKVAHEGDVVVCTLHYGSVLCVSATPVGGPRFVSFFVNEPPFSTPPIRPPDIVPPNQSVTVLQEASAAYACFWIVTVLRWVIFPPCTASSRVFPLPGL